MILHCPRSTRVVVSLKKAARSRLIWPCALARAEKMAARAGAGHVLFKILLDLRFHDAGNIGPVMDALRPIAARQSCW